VWEGGSGENRKVCVVCLFDRSKSHVVLATVVELINHFRVSCLN
jgi:hypothetical protein